MKDKLLSFNTEKSSVECVEKVTNFFCMSSVTGPEIPEDQEEDRSPLDLILVVDRSGSMSGEKIQLTKKTLEFVVNEMQKIDRIGVVAFDNEVEIVVDLMNCTKENKEKAIEKIRKIQDRGSTNLSGGLYAALEMLRKREKKNDVSSVLLFTDGEANAGLQNTNDIVKMMQGKMAHPTLQYGKQSESLLQTFRRRKKNKEKKIVKNEVTPKGGYNYISDNVNVYTFGFGKSHNEKMLKEISTHGNGIYYYISSNEDISESFVDCLGGLLSVVAKQIKLSFEALNGCVITDVHTAYVKEKNKDGTFVVNVPDLQSEEVRDMLVQMELPKLTEENLKFKVLKTLVSYVNKDGNKKEEEIVGIVMRPKETVKEEAPNIKIDEQKNRVMCTKVIDEVKILADADKFEKAKEKCKKMIEQIKESPSQNSKFCKALVDDLKEQMNGMNRKNYYGGMKQKMMCVNMGWKMQRSADIHSKSNAMYENKRKKRLKKKKRSIF